MRLTKANSGGGGGGLSGTGVAGEIAFFSAAAVLTSNSNLAWDNTNRLFTVSGRVRASQGADVSSANDLTLGVDGNFFKITGNTQINGIATTNWIAGNCITLLFSGAPTVKHNTAAGAGFASLYLAGGADFSATADDLLTLVYDGTVWRETARTVV
jgi:hypothetical protein